MGGGIGWREREVFDPKFVFGLFYISVSVVKINYKSINFCFGVTVTLQ